MLTSTVRYPFKKISPQDTRQLCPVSCGDDLIHTWRLFPQIPFRKSFYKLRPGCPVMPAFYIIILIQCLRLFSVEPLKLPKYPKFVASCAHM